MTVTTRATVPQTLARFDCVDDSTLTRALYTTDASLYRVEPLAVAFPRTRDELVEVVRAALEAEVSVTVRGAGTSCAGNAVGPGLVVDVARHLNRVVSIDPDAATATVEPGVVHATLQAQARPLGLRFGPDPSTHTRCTIGGMIGNNACGPRALGYGRTADNVVSLEVLTGSGEIVTVTSGEPSTGGLATDLRALVGANLGLVRTEFGRFGRQVSGYSMEHLLPERKFDLARFLAGTEGTLAVILSATVRLVRDLPHAAVVALGYPSMADAADAVPALLPHRPVAAEGMDRRIVDVVARTKGPAAVPALPAGDGWMFVELVGEDEAEVRSRAEALLATSGCLDGWVVDDPTAADRLWKIREDGAGLAGVSLADPAYPGWEDAAVLPERLGAYLREFDQLLQEFGLHGLPYGHFGDGCVHVRIDFPLEREGGAAVYRQFVERAAALVASHGGSMSGEHGDGRARSALLPAMYSPEAIALFGQVKALFDPRGLLNPGVLVDPVAVDADVRVAATVGSPLRLSDPHFVREVHQCSGVGKCVTATLGPGAVMCPSYQATRNEKDSTRGRARVLQEMVNGSLVAGGWRSPEVHEALDLCLSCKGCGRDCPTGIDMAAYKSRVLHESYKGRLRPLSHYTLGQLPRWLSLVHVVPGVSALANVALSVPGVGSLAKRLAGVDGRRPLPRFNPGGSQRRRAAHRGRSTGSGTADAGGGVPGRHGRVAVWVDSFTDAFEGTQVASLMAVLERAGYQPEVISDRACCGLTWITTGQLDGARAQLRGALEVLAPIAEAGVTIVGAEPSCLAVWRSDAPELLPDDPRVGIVASAVRTLAEVLSSTPDWQAPDLSGHEVVAQPHCHHASVLGWSADADVLGRTGATVTTLGGCCGLAGNFGVERGHYETSVAVAETALLPALRANPRAIVLADGFSCRKQVDDLTQRRAMTLAELLLTHS
ncbi:FAD-binding and (Fe-S)-binding domain-containing protein [Aestuariimicrobium kwangyangense]|uniref:FAD-binding and (Fe-S)-binding domain-containing protein n=1 Tax=Aestuariimicrobium kwangyangense TaxID=396389 RepID=UPI0003B78549|nr:FAD-binding and (Fe-S)-binding domain-containing protein [Aestuariimicrobium kwangyangense]